MNDINKIPLYTAKEIRQYTGVPEFILIHPPFRYHRLPDLNLENNKKKHSSLYLVVNDNRILYSFKDLIVCHIAAAFLNLRDTTPILIEEMVDILWTNKRIPKTNQAIPNHFGHRFRVPLPVERLYEEAALQAWQRLEYGQREKGKPVEVVGFHPYLSPAYFYEVPRGLAQDDNSIKIDPDIYQGKPFVAIGDRTLQVKHILNRYKEAQSIEEVQKHFSLPLENFSFPLKVVQAAITFGEEKVKRYWES